MIESIDIVDLVKELRLKMGLTQEEFAAKIGVTFCTVNRWENRKSKPSRMAVKILKQMIKDLDTNA